MTKERPNLAVEFRVGKTGVAEREQRERAAKLAEVMANRDRYIGRLSVEFRVGDRTPATASQEADARMRTIRAELEAASDDDFEAALYTDLSEGESHESPQPDEEAANTAAEFLAASGEEPPESPQPQFPVTYPFSGK